MRFTRLAVSFHLGLLCSLSFAQPHESLPKHLPRRQDVPEEKPMCGRIIDAVNDGYRLFFARDAHECLTSVPFDPAPALRFIDYYNDTMQFQSTLEHLKSPPPGYQQPAFDLMRSLQDLKQNVTDGVFQNQYDFEATMQHLVYSVHDAHVYLRAGVLSAFSFASPVALVTASIDGKETPKVYLAEDILFRKNNLTNGVTIDISPVSHVNGEPVVDFLTNFAALQSVGMLEPHADWNELMASPVQDVQGRNSILVGSATFYPGHTLNFTFEDPQREELQTHWLAVYDNTVFTGPLATGGDFYNFFVLGLLPASYDEVPLPASFGGVTDDEDIQPVVDGEQAEEQTSWYDTSFTAFPQITGVKTDNLSNYGANIVTGYFFEDMSTGVLSVPHFDHYEDDLGEFGDLVMEFMDGAEDKGLAHAVIDLQKNSGGSTASALLLFRELFPGVDPFAGSQRRTHESADFLGSATTHMYQELSAGTGDDRDVSLSLVADEWTIVTRLSAATGANFSSWEEYRGPRRQRDDDFSLVEQYDLKNPNFHAAAFDGWVLNRYLNESDGARRVPWTPDNVVLLTDGACSSACALFLELATQAGARTVVVGGAPGPGPMQAASGSRGMRVYTGHRLDVDFAWLHDYNQTAGTQQQSWAAGQEDRGVYVQYASFNLRDQLRADDTSTPLQFRYAAADCRLYFTVDSVYDMSVLWRDVARAAFEDPGLCVEDSTGYNTRAGSSSTAVPKPPPEPSAVVAAAPDIATSFTGDHDTLYPGGLPAGEQRILDLVPPDLCVKSSPSSNWACPHPGGSCRRKYFSCGAVGEMLSDLICVRMCSSEWTCPDGSCPGPRGRSIESSASRQHALAKDVPNQPGAMTLGYGYCPPPIDDATSCRRRGREPRPPPTPPKLGQVEEAPRKPIVGRVGLRAKPKTQASPLVIPQGPRRPPRIGKIG
ncbi:Peptidase S41 family protein ustP [Colletotrichum spinosum]|uniref:Peptidase S41 family protein ustP n=1 Tax=Colletotrichum spinosum TaxID=1347390 RepID=A0A4R8Q5R4_9PEZI|nr:Peptidase S41 family protein ustP [Colletotrichum spinosum]